MTRRFAAWVVLALILALMMPSTALAADSLSLSTQAEGEAGSPHKISWSYTGGQPASYDMRLYLGGTLIAKSRLEGTATSATIAAKSLAQAGAYSVKLYAMELDNSYIVSEVAFTLTGTAEVTPAPTACPPVTCATEPAKPCATEAPRTPTAQPERPTEKPVEPSAPTAKPTIASTATVRPATTPTAKPAATAKPSADPSGSNRAAMADEVVRQTNADRTKNGLSALTVDADLTRAACVRAQEIVSKFSHERPDGSNALSILSKAKGENIAKGQQTADKVMAAWMSSEGHRANILRSSFKSIGVCAYQVNGIMYWVQLFGN